MKWQKKMSKYVEKLLRERERRRSDVKELCCVGRINANVFAGTAEKLLHSMGIIGKLKPVTGLQRFSGLAVIGLLLWLQAVRFIINKSNVTVFIHQNQVDNPLYRKRFSNELCAEIGILCEVFGREQQIESLFPIDFLGIFYLSEKFAL